MPLEIANQLDVVDHASDLPGGGLWSGSLPASRARCLSSVTSAAPA